MPLDKRSGRIHLALIEGAHPFDVPGWHALFRSYDFLDYYPQALDNWLADWGGCRDDYDVALFYNMNMDGPETPLAQAAGQALHQFSMVGGGLLILHHALLSFPESDFMNAVTGMSDRSFGYDPDQDLRVAIANPDHPITEGVDAFALHDETYKMADARAADGNEVLFTTRCEKSMGTLGWTRELNKSRVFCLQPGHDNRVWTVPEFRLLLGQALQWLARRR